MGKLLKVGGVVALVLLASCQNIQVPFEHSFVVTIKNIELTGSGGPAKEDGHFRKFVVNVADYWNLYQELIHFVNTVEIDSAFIMVHNQDTLHDANLNIFISRDTSLTYQTIGQAIQLLQVSIARGETLTVTGQEYLQYFNQAALDSLSNFVLNGLFATYFVGYPEDTLSLTVDSLLFYVRVKGEK